MKFWENEKIFLAITGIPKHHALSANRKTGPMAQAWVLPKEKPPTDPDGQTLVCGSCPLKANGCYVVTSQAPLIVWRAYEDLPVVSQIPAFPLGLRITAYGEPAFVPLHVWQKLLSFASFHTGYTHQWRNLDPRRWGFLMASVETQAEAEAAWDLGWRTFRPVSRGTNLDAFDNETPCVNYTHGKQCYECRLCDGQHLNILGCVHGSHATKAETTLMQKEARQ